MFLLSALQRERDFAPLITALQKEKKPVLASGIASSLRELFPAAIAHNTGEKILLLFSEESEAVQCAASLSSVFARCFFFPARDFSLARVDSASFDFSVRRLQVLCRAVKGDYDVIVSTFEAACQATVPPRALEDVMATFRVGQEIKKEEVLARVIRAGYRLCDRVEGPGQVATRGDILDLYPVGSEEALRVEWFGDEIDAIAPFDLITQRRGEGRKEFTLTPAEELLFCEEDEKIIASFLREEEQHRAKKEERVAIRALIERVENHLSFPRDLFLSLRYSFATLLDYFPDAITLLYDQNAAREALSRTEKFLQEEMRSLLESGAVLPGLEKARLLLTYPELCAILSERRTILLENFFAGKSDIPPHGIFTFRTRTNTLPFSDRARVFEQIRSLREDGYRVAVLCANSMAQNAFAEALTASGVPCRLFEGKEEEEGDPKQVLVLSRLAPGGELIHAGFELSDSHLAVLAEEKSARDFTKRRRKSPLKKSARQKLLSYQDLAVGDYVVHDTHGIGIFRGVEKLRGASGNLQDFIKISYAGSDVLYVPCSSLDAVSKYIGPKSDSATLKLNKLGGTEWVKAKSRAKSAARDIAKKLIRLYADRNQSQGHAFSPDTTWQAEFEDAFPYGETEGQLRATREIKADMENARPMDRLLCGDVGFGKTEVALRGVFKCVMDGLQAAILVPTTILAWQHYQTLLTRFKGYPVRIAMLSRFVTKKEQKNVLARLEKGEVDIVVGTHRLLQDDVHFHALGFLVVDEEQRFGVTHKEKLKELSRGVDVLTLTATPIPRTLNMALGGIRDMSILEEAPEDRFPVQTYVLEYDAGVVEEAIRRELRRGGQVFYLDNNIGALNASKIRLQQAFPDAEIAVAHGKMDRDALSDVWKEMMDHRIDILLCTTIIETGVDLPDANTLIVENADHFGLSQLHQIRGRVGRSDRKAYAFFTYKRGGVLSEISTKRLEAIRDYTQFGSGFQIALRDLEIRGAGDLLGAEQSGHMDSVGFEMFMKILSDAVAQEKGEAPPPKTDCLVDLALDGYIPERYVPYPAERMDLYRKIASLRTQEDASDLTDEMIDRFGAIPPSVQNLFSVALLRAAAQRVGCEKITQKNRRITFSFASVKDEAILALSALYASRLDLSLSPPPSVTLTLRQGENPLVASEDLLHHLCGFIQSDQNGKV